MPRLNKVALVGHIGQNPDINTFQNGNKGVTLSVATDDSYRDKEGQTVKRTEWHRVAIYGNKLVETVEKLQAGSSLKGVQVYIEGKLRTRSWEDQNKVKRYTTEVIVTHWEGFQLLGKKANGAPPAAEEPAGDTQAPPAAADDADIPF